MSLSLFGCCPTWARQCHIISPPRFLAECRKKRLNPASFVLLCFVLFAVSGLCLVCIFNLSSVLYSPASVTVKLNCADVPLWIYSGTYLSGCVARSYIECPQCRYATACSESYANHMSLMHAGKTTSSLAVVSMATMSAVGMRLRSTLMREAAYCPCGYSSVFGSVVGTLPWQQAPPHNLSTSISLRAQSRHIH